MYLAGTASRCPCPGPQPARRPDPEGEPHRTFGTRHGAEPLHTTGCCQTTWRPQCPHAGRTGGLRVCEGGGERRRPQQTRLCGRMLCVFAGSCNSHSPKSPLAPQAHHTHMPHAICPSIVRHPPSVSYPISLVGLPYASRSRASTPEGHGGKQSTTSYLLSLSRFEAHGPRPPRPTGGPPPDAATITRPSLATPDKPPGLERGRSPWQCHGRTTTTTSRHVEGTAHYQGGATRRALKS